jgi:glycosyltransferase involved in cell wall biosynthesis
MPLVSGDIAPLVSVIIPSYNHGQYLLDALKSIWLQNYPAIEIIVVDDGSTDNTREILKEIPGVKYIYQRNQGLSAARNTGIINSSGEFLIFLDADDWLLPEAININVNYLLQNEELAFVSGAHEKAFVENGESLDIAQEVTNNHYIHLLEGNYIGMHATVTYRRWVFDNFKFDETLKACEDYDLYLKIARKFPVFHHVQKIAAYRIHNTNMSGNIPKMLFNILKVLDRQKKNSQSKQEKQALKNGRKIWKDYYCSLLYDQLLLNKSRLSMDAFFTLIKFRPQLGLKFIIKKSINA